MNIKDIRQKYPQYSDLSDQDLAKALHQKFYSDLPFEDFSGRIGLAPITPPSPVVASPADKLQKMSSILPASPAEGLTGSFEMFLPGFGETAPPAAKPAAPSVIPGAPTELTPEEEVVSGIRPEPKTKFQQFLEAAKPEDLTLKTAEGVVSTSRAAMEVFGANNALTQQMRGVEKYLASLASAQSKQDSQEIARIMKEAEDQGAGPQVRAALKAFTVAPIDMLAQAAGSTVPILLSAVAGTVGMLTASAAVGTGLVKGTIYDTVKEELLKVGTDPKVAEEKAQLAQDYNGKNLDMILAGTALGAVAGRTGVERLILNKVVARELSKRGAIGAAARGAVEEGIPEFAQAAQEKLAENIALQREGFEVPTMRGVIGAGTLEGVVGSALGAVTGPAARVKTTPEDTLIKKLDDKLKDNLGDVGEPPRAASTDEFNTLYTTLKSRLQREPSAEELEEVLDDYERTPGVSVEDVVGRFKPSVPTPVGAEAAGPSAIPSEKVEPGGLGIPSVPPVDVGGRKEPTLGALEPEVTAAPEVTPSPLANVFQERPESTAQEKSTARHYANLQNQPNSPVTQSLNALDAAIQKARDSYADIAEKLNIPSNEDMIGLGVRLPTPIAELFKYPSASGSAVRLVNASKSLTSGAKRGSPEKLQSAISQVQEEVDKVDQVIADALAAAEDPKVQATIDKLAEQVAVNKGRAARQAEIAALPPEQRADKIKEIEDEIRADLAAKRAPELETAPAVTPTLPGIPEGLNVPQFLDAATKLRAGKVMAVPFAQLKSLKSAGFVLPDNSLSPEGEALLDELAASTAPNKLRPSGETIKGKPDYNKRRMNKLLGQKLYGNPEKMPAVSVKEMMQNSFDAIKTLQEKGQLDEGVIQINVDPGSRIISVLDNGTGMTPKTLSTTFLTVAGTEKEGQRVSGGLGIAKMQFLFGNERIKVATLRDDTLSILESTGVELENAMDNPDMQPDIRIFRGSDIPDQYLQLFPDGHGTFAEVVVPESYVDSDTGETKPIKIPDSKSEYEVLDKSPLFANIDVTFNGRTVYVGSEFPYRDYTQFADVKFDWGTARIYVQKVPEKYFFGRDNVRFLSNGLWQFDGSVAVKTGSGTKAVPRYFYIDISPKSTVKPEDFNYPFDLNRQRFSPATDKGFTQLLNYMSLIYGAVDLGNEAKNFGSVQYIYEENGKIKTTPSQELAPKGDAGITKIAAEINAGDVIEVQDGKLIVQGRVIPELTPDDIKNSKINLDEFKIPQSEVDSKRVMLHDNVGLADPTVLQNLKTELADLRDKWYADKITNEEYRGQEEEIKEKIRQEELNPKVESLITLARKKYGERFDRFNYDIGTLFMDLRALVVDIMGSSYKELLNEGIGVSYDVKYRGVSIKIPFDGMFINPAVPEVTDNLDEAAGGTLGTMIHEFAHFKERGHDSDFAAEMQRIAYKLGALEFSGDQRYNELRKQIVDLYRKNASLFKYIHEVNTDANAKPIGKRFQDAGYFEAAVRRDVEGVAEFRGTAERRPPIPERVESGAGDFGAQRQPTRVPGEIATGSLEEQILNRALKPGSLSQPVAAAIARDDLSGALRILSTRLKDPLYKELTENFANLNLPTKIVFNGARDLTRRQIDLKTYKQQKRLFDYVSRTYPDFYDAYFQNYDREDALEKVYLGLQKLKAGNYKLGPVIAEFNDTLEVFDNTMPGLERYGAYYPAFDTINLSFEDATNDTLLHEVFHAATENVLTTYEQDPDSLPESVRAAAAEMNRMYQFAVDNVPIDFYGLSNVHEFVSELFTNKPFKEYLKKISYTPTRTPFFTRLVRTIFRMMGIDNLAGQAMATATQLFSAVRTKVPAPTGPRFAKGKHAKGLSQKTGSWRTAEQAGTKLTKELQDAITGRQSWNSVLPDIMGSMWDAGTTYFRRSILGFANLRQIDDLTKTKFPQISGAIRIIEQMIADRNRTMTKAKDILTDWTKAQAKSLGQSRLMGRVMLEATIRGIDPDTAQPGTIDPDFKAAWDALKPEFQQIYRRVRDFYADSINTMVREMKLRALQLPKAERQKLLKEINAKFGPDKLVKPYFPLRRFGKYWFQVGSGNFKEFYEFENPLQRELAFRKRRRELAGGNARQQGLVDTMRKGNGISELYSQNLSTTQVLKDAQELIDNVTSTNVPDIKKELKESLDQLIYILLPQQSVRKMFINRRAIQGASEDMLRVFATTAVHTAYQQSRFKFAEKFVNNLTTAREYIKDLPNSDVYDDYIKEVEKRAPTILSNEDTSMGAVVAGKLSDATFYFMLSAPFSAMLNLLGAAAITMPYIGGRYGYAKTNAYMLRNMSRYMATMPKRTLAPALKGQILQMQFPSIVEGGKLSPLLQRAANRFVEDNDINISQTNDIMDMGGRPSELYTGRYNTVKRVIAGLFHQSERLNREIALMSVFELAYEKFSKEPKKDLRGVIQRDAAGNPVPNTPDEAFELAILEAKDIAGLSLGDFTRQMKPRYFTPPLPSLIAKFKQYSVLATYVVARNFYYTVAAPFRKAEIEQFRQQMIADGVAPNIIDQRIAEADAQRRETYKEGRRRLAGILGVTFLLGGAEAMPFFTLGLGTLIKAMANDDDDEFFDWENWFKNYSETELGGYFVSLYKSLGMKEEEAKKAGRKTGEAIARGPVAVATGGSLTERVSLDPVDLWFRDARFSPDTREEVVNTVIANAGPVVGLMVNMAEGVELMQNGQYQRAFERMAPAIVSKPATAYRIATEDARTKSGIKLADNFSAWEIAMQVVGLQPERLAQAQKASIEATTMDQKIKDKKARIMDRMWMERENNEGFRDAMDELIKFNSKYPDYASKPEDVRASFKKRATDQTIAESAGARTTKKQYGRTREMTEYGRE